MIEKRRSAGGAVYGFRRRMHDSMQRGKTISKGQQEG